MGRTSRSLSVFVVVGFVGVASAGFGVLDGCGTKSEFQGTDAGVDAADPDTSVDLPDVAAGDGAACAVHCSGDLHSLVDCHGNVVKTCGVDDGCNPDNGQCIPACESAKAAKGSTGCDFYAVAPTDSQCFAIFVANTWNAPVTLGGDYAGAALNMKAITRVPTGSGASITYGSLPNGQVPPGQVGIVFFGPGCPITGAFGSSSVDGTGIGYSVHVTADHPVAAYDIFPYGGGESAVTSASLLLPTSAWDTNYVAVSPFEISTQTLAPAGVHIVAAENGTAITILPKSDIVGGIGVPAAKANVPTTYTINKGQQLAFLQSALLDGSPIQANKPVGLWATMSCFNVPIDTTFCDSAHQEIPPVRALGSEYALVRYRNRVANGPEETPPWRLLGLVDQTTLTWEPSTPPGAPTTLAAGQVATFSGAGPYVVHSQDDKHPFYAAAYMTGCSTTGDINVPPDGCMGDAEYVNVVPAQEFQSSYVFFTDPTYPETNLVLVRAKAGDGTFKDVSLDCAGTLSGWKPIGSGAYEYTRFDLVRGNFAKQGTCDNGRHEIKSTGPFGMTVWGWGSLITGTGSGNGFYSQAVSYAYPSGMSLKAINTVVIPTTPN